MREIQKTPLTASDVLEHVKDSDRTERINLPITRYGAIISAPNVIKDSDEVFGAPFHLLEMDEEELTQTEIRRLCGFIL